MSKLSHQEIAQKMTAIEGVEISTMMKTPCLRYRAAFIAMMFVDEYEAYIQEALLNAKLLAELSAK